MKKSTKVMGLTAITGAIMLMSFSLTSSSNSQSAIASSNCRGDYQHAITSIANDLNSGCISEATASTEYRKARISYNNCMKQMAFSAQH